MVKAFAKRSGARKSDKHGPKKSKAPKSRRESGMAAPSSHFHAAASRSPSSHHMSSYPSQAPMRRTTMKEESDVTVSICRNEYNEKLFHGVSELAAYRSLIGKARDHQLHRETGAMWNQVAHQILLVSFCVVEFLCGRVDNNRNLKTPVKTRTLHLSEPYDSRSTPHTAMQPRNE